MTIERKLKKRKGISTASRKSKGRLLQQWTRDKILELNPELEPDDCKSTSMGAGGEDVQLSPAAREMVPLSIECKARAKFAGYAFMEQAVSNSHKVQPVVVVKADRKKPLVMVDADYFFTLVRRSNKTISPED